MPHRPIFSRMTFCVLLGFAGVCAPAFATDAVSWSGTVARTYEQAESPALRMPTAVAVDATGAVFVADGVNDRIVEFASDGKSVREIRAVGEMKLSRPLGARFDGTGRLWIADTGHDRIIVRDKDGSLARTIVLPRPQDGHNSEPSDVVPLDDGKRAWIVDGHNHRLIRWDPAAEPSEFTPVGQQGSALGHFNYPFMAVADATGRLFVSDSLNGRIGVIGAAGKFAAPLGTYGVEPGELYRPKGVACDATGNVWVADGVIGVIQMFEPAGRYIGILRDASDNPMKFAYPAGIAFGPNGDLYVVELSANRVRQIRLQSKPQPTTVPGPSREKVAGGGGQSPACTICHIDWLPSFASGTGTPLMTQPASEANNPVASRGPTCLSCHDGTVMDSRRRVWVEHAHQTGITPPESIKVPDFLPLVDGKLACRTCHSAHGGGQQNQSLANAVFVRAEDGSGSLCASCHTKNKLGPAAGAHPTGGMPFVVPEELVKAGAKVGPNPRELTCYVCHEPHGSARNDLLVMGTESSQLCLTCHIKLRPGLWRPDAPREHPQNPPLQNAAQKQAVKDMGTKSGTGDTLICLSCHKIHRGISGRYILADTLKNSQLCLRCHPEREQMVNTSHDLRVSSPDCKNRIGQTPEESGPCGACHSFHRFARMPDPMPKDPSGLCVSCHQKDQCADKKAVAGQGHPYQARPDQLPAELKLRTFNTLEQSTTRPSEPSVIRTIACLTCHNPHDASHKYFLRLESEQLCSQCHTAKVANLAGAHDLSGRTDIKNAKGRTPVETGKCGFCHTMHDARGPSLWIGTTTAPSDADGTCTSCHRPGGLAAKKAETQYHHPTGPKTAEAASKLDTKLPLFRKPGEKKGDSYVSCGSCHDPHANSKATPALLRAGPPTSDLCTNCHKQPAALAGGLHDEHVRPAKWPEPSQKKSDLCLSCHQPHSNDPAQGLWTMAPRAKYAVEDAACLGCHQHIEWGGHGTRPAQPAASQPALQPVTTAGDLHGLPLVPTHPGKTSGSIGCKTCHDPHGPPGGQPRLLRAGRALDPGAMCLACHTELQYIGLSLHGRDQMKDFANGTGQPTQMLQCGPCHSVHAMGTTTRPATGPASFMKGDPGRCTGCHSKEGGAPTVYVPDHFRSLTNVQEPGMPGFLPLLNDNGEIGRSGRIACITCHMPHGRPPGPDFPAIDPHKITADQVRAMMPMVAPFRAPNLCTSCHGFDGMLRFLYFHEPEKRGGTRK